VLRCWELPRWNWLRVYDADSGLFLASDLVRHSRNVSYCPSPLLSPSALCLPCKGTFLQGTYLLLAAVPPLRQLLGGGGVILAHRTDPLAPFGIASLADGTDEGFGINMRSFR
jgi:hypothetical protein